MRQERAGTGMKHPASAVKYQIDHSNEEEEKINKEEVGHLPCKTVNHYNATSACLQTSPGECQDEPRHCCGLSDTCSSRKETQQTDIR